MTVGDQVTFRPYGKRRLVKGKVVSVHPDHVTVVSGAKFYAVAPAQLRPTK